MRGNILLAVSAIFCISCIGFVAWQYKLNSDTQNYWANSASADGLWLESNNSHIAAMQRQERFSGYVTGFLYPDPANIQVDLVAKNIPGYNASQEFPVTINIPQSVDSRNLQELKAATAGGTPEVVRVSKAAMLQALRTENQAQFTFELVSQSLTGDHFDYAQLISFYYPQIVQ